jgi:small-conductance mechanosensitive channel
MATVKPIDKLNIWQQINWKKKVRKVFIAWFLIIFLAIITSAAIASGQTSPSSSVGIPVVFDGQTLFMIRDNFGTISPQGRRIRAQRRIAEFAANYRIPLDDLHINAMDGDGIPVDVIVAGDQTIHFITELDARTAGKKRQQLSTEILEKIRSAVQNYRQVRSLQMIALGVLFSLLATVPLLVSFRFLNRLFLIAYQRIRAWEDTYIQAVRLWGVEIIAPNQLDDLTTFVTKLVQTSINLGLLLLYFAFVLNQFPWTRELASYVWAVLLEKIQLGWQSLLVFIPNLITILLIITVTYFFNNLFKTFFWRVRDGRLTIPGFYQDWAVPTYRMVTILLIAITIMAILPLLPWFQSPIFQGIGVVFGLLLSLGSSSVVSNVISGYVLIYTRAFRSGDVVTIDRIEGQIIDKNLLVTRLLTSSNEVVSIPNSKIINSSIKNLNFSSQELNKPLIVKATVYLGYDVPWSKVYETLIKAATLMPGISQSYTPFVYQKELNNVYVTYILGVYLEIDFLEGKTAKDFEQFYSLLNENIRGCCQEGGIRIFAPLYYPDPTLSK